MTTARIDPARPDLGGNLHRGDPATFCPTVWRYLVDRFAVHSVLDVGCGEGHAIDWFARQGVYAVGIDGLVDNVANAVHPIVWHDLTAGPFFMPVDLVWCCEVAEHIDERYVGNFLDTLANGKVVAMTHAVPGQPGWHHVNCQPAEYWIEHIERRGYELQPALPVSDPWFTYWGASGMVFAK